MRINDKSLKLLRQHVMVDSDISESERARSLEVIARVKAGLDSGEFVAVDRMSMIKDAAEKKRFRSKVKAKSRKVRRKTTKAEVKSIRSVDAFDEEFMYSSDKENREYAELVGITDAYNETKRFDNDWN